MAELWLTGKIVQETTKVDKENERETVFQIKASLSADECADLQRLIGRNCDMHIEDSITHMARSQERAGQMRLPLDDTPAAEPVMVEVPAPTLVPRDRVLWVQGPSGLWHAYLWTEEGQESPERYLCGVAIEGGPTVESQIWDGALWLPDGEACPTCLPLVDLGEPANEPESGSDSSPTDEGEKAEPGGEDALTDAVERALADEGFTVVVVEGFFGEGGRDE